MNKILMLCIMLLVAPMSVRASSCVENFHWLKTTFEENDAGFEYALSSKNPGAYETHNKNTSALADKSLSAKDCHSLLSEWLLFFRKGHIGLRLVPVAVTETADSTSDARWESIEMSEEALKSYLSGIIQPSYEGIWESSSYTLAIIKKDQQYVGFLTQDSGSNWKKGYIKIRLTNTASGDLKTTYYMGDFSPLEFDKTELLGANYLQTGRFYWHRVNSISTADTSNEAHIATFVESISASGPSIRKISTDTLVLAIPSFNGSQKRAIDALLERNHELIINTKNMIIDIRGNGGGSDSSYAKIIPYLYTNPIRVMGMEFLSTPLNNARMNQLLENPDFPKESHAWATNGLKILNKRLGEFVNIDDKDVDIVTEDSVYAYPKNVGIIIHGSNGSTAEQFLLAAKQSKKVKLFGSKTAGVLDISNMHVLDSPDKSLQLAYSLSKTLRIPDMTIDGKGINPDYYLDSSIKGYDWLDHVRTVLEE